MNKGNILAVLLMLTASAAHASALNTTDLKGVTPEAMAKVNARAEAIAKVITKTVPGAKKVAGCVAAACQFIVYRHFSVLDAFDPGVSGTFNVHMSGVDTPDGYKNHQGGHVEVKSTAGGRLYEPQFTHAAEEPGGATEKLVENVNKHCKSGGGNDKGGGRGTGAESPDGFHLVHEWMNKNPDWDTSLDYGEPFFPGPNQSNNRTEALQKVAQSDGVVEKVAEKYPSLDFRAVVSRFVSGKATGQDIEQLRVGLSAAGMMATPIGSSLMLNAARQLVFMRAGVVPVWIVPEGALDVKPFPEPKPGEVY